jgi:hypothetical protein
MVKEEEQEEEQTIVGWEKFVLTAVVAVVVYAVVVYVLFQLMFLRKRMNLDLMVLQWLHLLLLLLNLLHLLLHQFLLKLIQE